MRHAEGETSAATAADADGSQAGSGAVAGALTGLGLGTLAGLGVLAGVIPVVGPAIAAGTLGVILSNAAAGAGIAGLAGALVGAGVPEHEARYYHDEFEVGPHHRHRRGRWPGRRGGRHPPAVRGVRHEHAVPGRNRPATATRSASASAHVAAGHAGDTIQLKEERLHAEKRPVETGEVTVRKEVHTETKTLEVPVEREEVVIERTAMHGRTEGGDIAAGDIREGEVIRIPVREEQVNVTKDAVVTEEVKVGKRVVQDTERVSGQVRKEEVKIDKVGDVDVKTHGTGKDPA